MMENNRTGRAILKRLAALALCLAQLMPVFAAAETTRMDTMRYQGANVITDADASTPDQIVVTKYDLYNFGNTGDDRITTPQNNDPQTVLNQMKPASGDVAFDKRAYFETDAQAEDGIVKVEIDMKGEVGVAPPVDVVFVLDRSGSMNLHHSDDFTWNGTQYAIDTTKSAIANASCHPCLSETHYYKVALRYNGQTVYQNIYPAQLAKLTNQQLRSDLRDDTNHQYGLDDYFDEFAAEYQKIKTTVEEDAITLAFTSGQTSNTSWWPVAQLYAKYLYASLNRISADMIFQQDTTSDNPTNNALYKQRIAEADKEKKLRIENTYTNYNAENDPLTNNIIYECPRLVYQSFAREHYKDGSDTAISIWGEFSNDDDDTNDTILEAYLKKQAALRPEGATGNSVQDGNYFSPALVDTENGCIDRAMAARQAINEFISTVFIANPENRVGYTAFHEMVAAGNVIGLTSASNAEALARIWTDQGGDGGTNYTDGLRKALDDVLIPGQGDEGLEDKDTYVILISDGVPTYENTEEQITGQTELIQNRKKTHIYAVGIQAGNSTALENMWRVTQIIIRTAKR